MMTNARLSYRLLAMILAFLMVLTSVPVVAFADEGTTNIQDTTTGTTNPSGSESGNEENTTQEPGNKSDLEALLKAGGVVTLDRDYVLDQTIVITNDVEIELNGHTITYTSTGDVGGYYVFEIGVWDEEVAENCVAPVVSIRDSSAARTGALISTYTGVLSLVHGKLNVESGYYKAATAQPVLRLNAQAPNTDDVDLLTVYGGRFDGQMPQTFDGRFVIRGGAFDSPNVANLVINSIFKVRSFVEIEGSEYYVVSVGINEQDKDEILDWYLDELEKNAGESYDLVIENIEEYMWYARLVAEGEFTYTAEDGNDYTIYANDDVVILAADITFGTEYNDVLYDIYAPIGSERAPFEGTFIGNKNYADATLPVDVPSIVVPEIINAINAGIFGYVKNATIQHLTVSVNEIKNVANIMGEDNYTHLYTSSGVLVGTVAGTAEISDIDAASDKYTLIGAILEGATLKLDGPVHTLDGEGKEVAPAHGFIDTAELYKNKLGDVVISGGFYSFELKADEIREDLARTREAIEKAKVYNVDDPNWYSVTDKDNFVALLNNEGVGEYGYFETLQAAIDAADADHVSIEILADIVDENVEIAADDKLVINYYGYNHKGIITVNGELELLAKSGQIGSVVNKGTLVVDANDAVILDIDNHATLTVKSGYVTKLAKAEEATVAIMGGSFKEMTLSKTGYVITGGYFTDAAKPLPEMADGKNGYAVAINNNEENKADYPWTVKNEGNEAKVVVGDTIVVFEFLEEALDYIQDNKAQDATVTLLQDVHLADLYKTSTKVAYTLDLGGHTIVADAHAFVFAAGTVTIKNGTIEAAKNAVWVDTTGSNAEVVLTLADDLTIKSATTGLVVNAGNGNVVVNTYANIDAKTNAIVVDNGFGANACEINVKGGKISASDIAVVVNENAAVVSIDGANIKGATTGIVAQAGKVLISGDETVVAGSEHAVLVDYTGADVAVIINGGTFNSDGNAFEFVNNKRSIPGVTLEINGGYFNAPVVSNGVYGFVTGGYFVKIDRNLVAEGLARSDAPDYEYNGVKYYTILTDVEAFLIDAVSGKYVGYQFLETAIYEAAHGATVYLGMNITDKDGDAFIVVPDPQDPTKTIVRQPAGDAEHTSYSIQLTKCISITSYDPDNTGVRYALINVSFDLYTYKDAPTDHVGDPETRYEFTNIEFKDNSHIHYHKQQGASYLIIDNVVANVTGGAFLFAWDAMGVVENDYELLLTLKLTNSQISATDVNNQYNFAVEVEATLCDGSIIANNTFGSETAPFTETYVFKAFKVESAEQNDGVRAIIKVENNTVYMKNENRPASAFEFAGENEFLMLGKTNTIISLNTEVEGSLPYRIAMYSVGQNGIVVDLVDGAKQSTINGTPLTLQNIYYQPGQAPKYVGILIELVEETYYDADLGESVTEKLIIAGTFDVYTDEINDKIARGAYLKYTEFANGYKNMEDYVGYVVTRFLGTGTIDDPYVIPDDDAMEKVLHDGVEDGAYYVVGDGVSADLVDEFIQDLNDGTDTYTGETGIDNSVACVYYFYATYEGISEDTYVKYGYKNLEEALSEGDARTVALLCDLDTHEDIFASAETTILTIKDITTTIDLAKYDISADANAVVIDGATVTLTASKDLSILSVKNLTPGSAITLQNAASLTIEENVHIDVYGDDVTAIAVRDNATLVVEGIIWSDACAIMITGVATNVTVTDWAMIETWMDVVAIKQTSNGTLTISGGEICGGVVVENGSFVMTDGYIFNENGYALYINQLDETAAISVSIDGGIIKGSKASLYEENALEAEKRNVTMTLTGGIFMGIVYSDSCTGFINDYDVYFVDYNYDSDFESLYGETRDNTYMPALNYFGKTADGVQLARSYEAKLITDDFGDEFYAWYAEDAVALYDNLYYSTMFEALNDIYINGVAGEGDVYTVTMIADSEEPLGILANCTTIIDLAGFEVSLPVCDPSYANFVNVCVCPVTSLTIKNGTLNLVDFAGKVYDVQVNSSLVLEDVTLNGTASIQVRSELTLKGTTTINTDILLTPYYRYVIDGPDAVLNVNDENVTVNGDVYAKWQVEAPHVAMYVNKTGKPVLNISAGTFNGTVRLVDTTEFSSGLPLVYDHGFVGNITGGYFAFPEDDTYLPNNMLCAKGKAFAIGDKALPEGITTDSGRTTYYEIAEAVAEAEFYTIVGNDGEATVWVGFATLEEALEALSDTGNARLIKDLTLSKDVDLDINDQMTLNMEGYNLDLESGVNFNLSNHYDLTVTGGDIVAYSTAFNLSDFASLTIKEANVDGVDENAYGAAIKMATGAKLYVYDATVSSRGGNVIQTDYDDSNLFITLGAGAVIEAPQETWYYAIRGYSYANIKIHNATITGGNGISAASGSLTISGANTVIDVVQYAINIYVGTNYDWTTGVSTPDALAVDITGGQFKGQYAFYESSDRAGICNILISNGLDSVPTFTGNFYSVQEGFIRGGAFQYVEDGTYLPGASFEHMMEGFWPVFNADDNYYYVEYKGIKAIGYAEADNHIVYIATINDGLDAVADGKQIEILVDAEDVFTLGAENTDKDITLDLNGNTLTMTGTSVVTAPATLTIVNGTITPAEDVEFVLSIMADKAKATASVVLGADVVIEGAVLNYGVLELTENAVVENVTIDIYERQTTNSYLKIHSADAMVSDTLTIGRTNPYRNAGIPQIDMTAGNIYKLALLEHNDPEIYVDPTYSYDVEAGKNSITGGNIGIGTDVALVELFVKEGYQFAEFSTKYAIFAEAAEGEVAAPEIVYNDLLVGSGLEMHPYINNLDTIEGYSAKVNGHDATLAMGTNDMPYVIIPLSALQVAKSFEVTIIDAEGNVVLTDDVCFVETAKELLKAGDEDVANLIYALLNYAEAFTQYFAKDDYTSILALKNVLADSAYANGALNDTIDGVIETVNNVSTYTITDANGEGISSTRVGVNYFNYNTYGRVGITPNVVFNDKFDLVLDFRFEKADMDALDVANFVATVTADKEGFTAQTVAVTKAVNAAGNTVLRVVLEDISAMDIEVNYTITVNTVDETGSMAYTMSVASYMAERMLNDSSESYKTLMKAMYLYHKAAEPFDSDIIELAE